MFRIVAMTALSLSTTTVEAQTVTRTHLSLAAAERLAAQAELQARREKVDVTVVVLDSAGLPILVRRMDGAPFGSVEVAIGKARTAAAWGVSSGQFEQWLTSGGTRLLTLPQTVMIEGGLPIVIQSKQVGSVGVSGGSSAQDVAIAKAGLSLLERQP